jgi:glycosyltransferase involved in cell wall biosynthesis
MKVLYTSPVLEHPATGGPQLRVENSIKALSAKCELHVISRSAAPRAEQAHAAEFFARYSKVYRGAARFEGRALRDKLRRRLRATLRDPFDADSRDDAQQILDHADLHGIDTVWFGYGNISYPLIRRLRRMRPGLKLVCDTDSVWSRFVLRELPYAKGLRKLSIRQAGKAKEREERAWVELCDVTTAVSEVDAAYYRGLTLHPDRIHVFPNVIDVDTYAAAPPRPAGFRSPSIFLAGTFAHSHSPMSVATRWILDEVLPRLLKRIPGLHFYIVGTNSDTEFGHLNGPGITATGRLDSVLPYLCHADVALVPLQFESGTRFKILEAGACGTPLVSTTLGAEGLPVVAGRDILLADQPESFADAVLRLVEDRPFALRLAASCKRLVNDQFSVSRLAEDAARILSHLHRGAPTPAAR